MEAEVTTEIMITDFLTGSGDRVVQTSNPKLAKELEDFLKQSISKGYLRFTPENQGSRSPSRMTMLNPDPKPTKIESRNRMTLSAV
jgi:hypothetical protein